SRFKLDSELACCAEPLVGPLREHASKRSIQTGDAAQCPLTPSRRFAENGSHCLCRIRSHKRVGTSREFMKDDSERKNVGAEIYRPSQHLFGRHVCRSTNPYPRSGEECSGIASSAGSCTLGACQLRQTEVHHLDVPLFGHHNIGWFQIAMHDA